jgi:cellulose biosynthesis protein BcsE
MGYNRNNRMNPPTYTLKSLGIPGIPPSIDTLLNGAIYAAIVDSVPARLSIIIQSLKANLVAGNTCVLLTSMTPGVFLIRAESSGVDFSEDIAQSRLYLFSQEGDYVTNIFRLGVKRFLQEFDHFRVPKKSFFLFDQASELFTMSDQNMMQTQAMDYCDWMKPYGNTALFLFSSSENEKSANAILDYFSGVARVIQNKTGLELLIDFWYSQDGAIAAKVFPVSLDKTGFIRIEPSAINAPPPQMATSENQSGLIPADSDSVIYLGPDFEAFSATLNQSGEWKQAQSLVNLVHLCKDAIAATVVISLDRNTELKQIAETVHYMRLSRGNKLKIVIRESGFSLRFLNELLLLRLGANLIIHQQVTQQRLPMLWGLLAGQTYTRKIEENFDLAFCGMLACNYKGYIDLATFCNESLKMLTRGEKQDIPLTLIIAAYHEQASPAEVLSQINTVRNGDIFSSDQTHCYMFMHACAEENLADAFSRITEQKQAILFSSIDYFSKTEHIRNTLETIIQSGYIAPDFSASIAQLKAARLIDNAAGEEAVIASDEASVRIGDAQTQFAQIQDIAAIEVPPSIPEKPNELTDMMKRLAARHPAEIPPLF